MALNVPLVNITHAATYRLAYDRLAAQGYGVPEPLPARNRRIFRGQQSLQDALNSWAPLLAKVEMTAPSLILTGGLYVNKAGQHGQGLAIDVDGLWWSDTNKFLTINAPQDWYRYLRIEASCARCSAPSSTTIIMPPIAIIGIVIWAPVRPGAMWNPR